jgi:hypothetical protein
MVMVMAFLVSGNFHTLRPKGQICQVNNRLRVHTRTGFATFVEHLDGQDV